MTNYDLGTWSLCPINVFVTAVLRCMNCSCNYLVLHLHVFHLQAKVLISHIAPDWHRSACDWKLMTLVQHWNLLRRSGGEVPSRMAVLLGLGAAWKGPGWFRGARRLLCGFALWLSLVSLQRLTHWEQASRTNIVLWYTPACPSSMRKVKWEQALLFASVTVSRCGGFHTQDKGKR